MDQRNVKTSIGGVSKGTAEVHPGAGAQSFRGAPVFFNALSLNNRDTEHYKYKIITCFFMHFHLAVHLITNRLKKYLPLSYNTKIPYHNPANSFPLIPDVRHLQQNSTYSLVLQ